MHAQYVADEATIPLLIFSSLYHFFCSHVWTPRPFVHHNPHILSLVFSTTTIQSVLCDTQRGGKKKKE
jgi:hypothetical protein